MICRVALALGIAVASAWAQLPASGVLSPSDEPLFRDEVARIENLLRADPGECALTYQMARTWASGKQWPETIQWLHRAMELRAGFDPSRDRVFAELHGTREFAALVQRAVEATPAVSHSRIAFRIAEGDLKPESVAYDPSTQAFYFGSMAKGKVVRCSASGDCRQFAAGLNTVLGLKVDGHSLWLLNNAAADSSLIRYDLASGNLLRRFSTGAPGHLFNDLTVAPDGGVYLTDTRAGAVWRLARGSDKLVQLAGRFTAANGIAIAPDGRLLFVSAFPDGVQVVDLRKGVAAPLGHPPNVCLANIDGLYFHRGALIAIQNGFMSPRVIRLTLSRDGRSIVRAEILERRNPLFDGITTGVLDGSNFFYMANIQDDKSEQFDPIAVLRLLLP